MVVGCIYICKIKCNIAKRKSLKLCIEQRKKYL